MNTCMLDIQFTYKNTLFALLQGMRWNTASAYLRPALNRPVKNLTVESKVLASKILFEGKKAVGIEYIQNGETKQAYAEKEVRI